MVNSRDQIMGPSSIEELSLLIREQQHYHTASEMLKPAGIESGPS
ncbi:hypothetical protein SLEP1_g53591 [Rubroshorea leprosula]|uniref:Uncharacterized protein n=1 Tax=Rubroshorea leprosula TaxID=152421 RepID=A0AAV5MDR8_9ROSI|nr:hypothetical protein SLEP1_g53591 [Rubroshorea leprosula]